ncbi:pro-FMRFamide-related neuropeptide VF [Discoglossus pictus]
MFFGSKMMFIYFAICIASSVCLEDPSVTNMESAEKYEDLMESREDIQSQNNINSQEVRYWRINGLNEIGLNKYSNLPMLERAFLEERDIKPAANLPLRFGRTPEDKVAKSVPNLPQRFGRYLSAKANIQSAANLPQRFGRALNGGRFVQPLATLPLRFGRATHLQGLQYGMNSHPMEMKKSEEDNDRIQGLNYDYERKLQM